MFPPTFDSARFVPLEEHNEEIQILQDKLMETHDKLMEQLDICQEQQQLIVELHSKLSCSEAVFGGIDASLDSSRPGPTSSRLREVHSLGFGANEKTELTLWDPSNSLGPHSSPHPLPMSYQSFGSQGSQGGHAQSLTTSGDKKASFQADLEALHQRLVEEVCEKERLKQQLEQAQRTIQKLSNPQSGLVRKQVGSIVKITTSASKIRTSRTSARRDLACTNENIDHSREADSIKSSRALFASKRQNCFSINSSNGHVLQDNTNIGQTTSKPTKSRLHYEQTLSLIQQLEKAEANIRNRTANFSEQ